MTAITDAEIVTQFNRLDDVAKRLTLEIINGLSRGWLTGEEVEAAAHRIRAGADKVNELENLVDLSNHRIYAAALPGEVS
jgi:hypothetical protein